MKDFEITISCVSNKLGIYEENGSGCIYKGETIKDIISAIQDYLENEL